MADWREHVNLDIASPEPGSLPGGRDEFHAKPDRSRE
jgi:hypothetical protein